MGGGKGGGGGSQIVGYRYKMALLMGLCRGPVDEVVQINADDLPIWTGGGIIDNSTVTINSPDVFGGDTKEGGIAGPAEFMFGADTQTTVGSDAEAYIGGRLSSPPGTYFGDEATFVPDPGYVDGSYPAIGGLRGVLTMFFNGLICSNSPYPKAWSFRVRRYSKGWHGGTAWYGEEALIATVDAGGHQIYGMNGAHILVECLTNPVWGRGLSLSALDETSFISGANVMCREGLALCLLWDRTTTLADFMQTVINHIGAVIYPDRTTGLLTLKLLRKDYNVADLPVFDYSSGLLSIDDDQTTAPDNSHSELIVNYIDAYTGRPGQVRVQNLAGIQANQTVTSTKVDYPGAPTAAIALRLASRDLQMQGAGIKRYSLTLDRRGRKITPGGVFRINVPDRSIADMVLRAGKVEEGPIGSQTVKVVAVQDVFGLEATTYAGTPDRTWSPPPKTAIPVVDRRIEEMNYRDAVRALTVAELGALSVESGAPVVVAKAPTGLTTDYILDTHAVGESYVHHGAFGWTPSAILDGAIGYYDTSIVIKSMYLVNLAALPSVAWLDDELVYLTAFDPPSRTLTVGRGAVDTIPTPHADGARIWFAEHAQAADSREYTVGEIVSTKLLTRTNTSTLAEIDAPEDTTTIAMRQGRPYVPGDFKIGGTPFADVSTLIGDAVLTWTHRDRVTQADHVLVHQDASTGPETGTTYTVRIYDGSSDGTGMTAGYTPGSSRSDGVGDYVGMSFVPGATRDCTGLGLRMMAGNTGDHDVYLLDSSNVVLAHEKIDLTGKTPGKFYYATIPPLSLTSGATYTVLRLLLTGENWVDAGAVSLTGAGSALATLRTSPGGGDTYTASGQMYGGVDIRWSSLKRTESGITDDTWTYTAAMASSDGLGSRYTIQLESVRDTYPSFQKYNWTIPRVAGGYGKGYGLRYG